MSRFIKKIVSKKKLYKKVRDFSKNKMSDAFSKLGCPSFINTTCKEVGISAPTAVQSACVKQIITGHNCIAISQTGTGKTAAFALPIISTLSKDPYGIYALVISPTRELARQICQQFQLFGKGIRADICEVIGGMPITEQASYLEKNPHIVVATPGRILQHLKNAASGITHFSFSNLRYLVLDEVDRLFKDGYWEDVLEIIKFLPEERQTLCFSATKSDEINLETILTKPPEVKSCPLPTTPGKGWMSKDKNTFYWEPDEQLRPKIQHVKVIVHDESREVYLTIIIKKLMEQDNYNQVLVFTNTKASAEENTLILRHFGYKTAVMHSDMSEDERLRELEEFRAGRQRILIATDVAARGLDIPFVDTVIHFNAPQIATTYVHRAGRTGRAGRSGRSILFISPKEKKIEEAIIKELGQDFEELVLEKDDMKSQTKVFWAKKDAKITMKENDFGKRDEMLKKLDAIKKGEEVKPDIE